MTLLLALLLSLPVQSATPWIEASNALAREYAKADGATFPERASAAGLREFDGKALFLEKDANARELEFLQGWISRLKEEAGKAHDENLRLDLTILRDHLTLRAREIELEEKHGVVSFLPGSRFVLESLMQLVNEQSPAERKAAAVERFRLYVRGDETHPPFFTAIQNRALADELRFQKKRLMPLRAEIEQYLAESPAYVQGVGQLLAKSGKPGWEEDFVAFREQSQAFDGFLREHLLPLARRDFKLPKEIYAHTLRMRGIQQEPNDLLREAREAYKRLYKEFRVVAKEVAKQQGWKRSDPPSVIRELKKRQVLRPEEVKPLFESAARSLEEILRREDLVSIPKAPLRIRVAGEAESLANPVPHLTEPPLVDNHGERPEFVVPSFASGTSVLDDFSYQAAALVLTAHEGRPGHDLQFSSMLDNGTSMIRARYAFNNANVEGWGLYAEELIYPYLPLQARLVALQMRLIRVARAFLDPEVQLGKIRPRDVPKFLVSELGLSERLAQLELRRFQYDNPGQAPSYYYGLARMESARRRVASSLGNRFTARCFHDGVLSLGMLPVGLIGAELEKNLRCSGSQARLPSATPLN